MMSVSILALVAALPALCSAERGKHIAFHDAVAIDGRLSLGDTADLEAVPEPLRNRAKALVIATGRHAAVVQVQAIAARFRAQMPILACWFDQAESGSINIHHTGHQDTSVRENDPPMIVALPNVVNIGDRLNLEVSVGPVHIQREVVAMQPAHAGQRMFVQGADGKTLSVRYAGENQ